jgi:hypothetical protein
MTRPNNKIIIYKAPGGSISLEVKLEGESVWLSLNQMADLFERDKSVISRHLRNIYKTRELDQKSTVAFFATVQSEGRRRVEGRPLQRVCLKTNQGQRDFEGGSQSCHGKKSGLVGKGAIMRKKTNFNLYVEEQLKDRGLRSGSERLVKLGTWPSKLLHCARNADYRRKSWPGGLVHLSSRQWSAPLRLDRYS